MGVADDDDDATGEVAAVVAVEERREEGADDEGALEVDTEADGERPFPGLGAGAADDDAGVGRDATATGRPAIVLGGIFAVGFWDGVGDRVWAMGREWAG